MEAAETDLEWMFNIKKLGAIRQLLGMVGILPVYKALIKYTIVPGPSRILSAELTVAFAAHAAVEPKER
ncbi:hypothetical protein B0H16DRAFT_1889565 [Mycena metata]|uniref:Uncharacterized protein n=1 Tax=Mycena metata TaxID=1033252 RepID=A0AAD7IJH3_9AGAR|nr:hypothetical protein B0H16DRAFT_1889565 [Mycena metata]